MGLLDASLGTVDPSVSGLLDTLAIDSRLQSIGRVETAWGLPALPSMVRLDLATNAGIPDAQEFLFGISADLSEASRAEPVQTGLAPLPELGFQPSLTQSLQRQFSDLAGLNPPEALSDTSITDLKMRGIRSGVLDPTTPIDDRWSPQLNNVRYELARADYQERLSGDRHGALSLESLVLETLALVLD